MTSGAWRIAAWRAGAQGRGAQGRCLPGEAPTAVEHTPQHTCDCFDQHVRSEVLVEPWQRLFNGYCPSALAHLTHHLFDRGIGAVKHHHRIALPWSDLDPSDPSSGICLLASSHLSKGHPVMQMTQPGAVGRPLGVAHVVQGSMWRMWCKGNAPGQAARSVSQH